MNQDENMKDGKYEEALERARQGMPIDEVFPELKESEDERIRKDLVNYFHGAPLEHPEKEVLAWLEKQKESQPLMRDGEIEDKKRDIVAAIRKYYPTDYAEYLTSFLKGLSPEDNSEDEYGQEMLGIAYKLMYEHIPENLRTQEFYDSLKFMREYTGKVAIIHPYEQQPAKKLGGTFTSYDMAKTFTEGQNYVIAHPEKFGLCKPAEWGEEDEYKVDVICKLIEHATIIPRSGDDDTGIPPTRLNDKYIAPPHYFDDETKARDYYTDMLLRYPNYEVEFEKKP